MLRRCTRRAARTSAGPTLPNSLSNTTCGLSSIGSGAVRMRDSSGGVGRPVHEIELVYAQLYPSPQLLELAFGSSMAS
jgi:hypothetical protein